VEGTYLFSQLRFFSWSYDNEHRSLLPKRKEKILQDLWMLSHSPSNAEGAQQRVRGGMRNPQPSKGTRARRALGKSLLEFPSWEEGHTSEDSVTVPGNSSLLADLSCGLFLDFGKAE
jgi:hypothetical protein